MAFIPVFNTAQIEIRAANQGVPVENTWYAEKVTPWTQSSLDDLTAAVANAVGAGWLAQLPSTWVGTEVYAKDLTAPIAFQSTDVTIAGMPGLATGTPLPNNVTLAIARRSGLTGRSARGRIFWMGMTQLFLDTNENFVSSGTAGVLVANCEEVDIAIATVGATSVIVSRFTGGAARVVGETFPVADWIVTDLRVDTMRERLG